MHFKTDLTFNPDLKPFSTNYGTPFMLLYESIQCLKSKSNTVRTANKTEIANAA